MEQTDDLVEKASLFNGEPQYENFCSVQTQNTMSEMAPAWHPYDFPTGQSIHLPTSYEFGGSKRNLHALLGATHTSALLVLHRGEVRYEKYWLTGGRDIQWISMSVAKSFVSALVGIAVSEGFINSVNDPISDYVPMLKGSAYDGVSIKNVLQMSSGARWNEDYSDPESEIFRLSEATGPGGSFDVFMATMPRETEPGTRCMYNSADTQALGMLVAEATGKSLTAYMQEKLYTPLGMESTGYWVTDSCGREMAYAGLLMTARDFAKLGELYRNQGMWAGQALVPSDYVEQSVRADAPHLQSGGPVVGDHPLGPGYGYQWWLPAGDLGDYSAIGVYNQYVYVNPADETTIVKLSANPAYGTTSREEENKDVENIAALRSISQVCRAM
ncbi:MAG: serine hydrolase [Pseudomonadales bacterium]|nr:serine hydrolase [Pseudomonadales bacterium]